MNSRSAPIDLKTVKLEYRVILDLVPEGSTVLDLGCGNGDLLHLLETNKNVKGSGIEIDEQAVRRCAALGISVSQQDIESGLSDYGDKSFDFVILNQSLQQVVKLEQVLKETMRVGREVIIGFPNFCYYKSRIQIFFGGRTPVTPSLPNMWYDTPNLHFLSIFDFADYCEKRNIRVKKTVCMDEKKIIRRLPNLFAQTGIFLLTSNREK
jgi:methionine biosynthesis protein MetW